jgi:hypothetical protein
LAWRFEAHPVNEENTQNQRRSEYDFENGIRDRYAERYREGSNVVLLDPDLAKLFPDSESVNRALRALAEIAERNAKRGEE